MKNTGQEKLPVVCRIRHDELAFVDSVSATTVGVNCKEIR